jgi:cellulose synthase/poly-beta-1,6-N-acetylglucosamine synthase-like glycosyltransferase
MGHFLFSGLFWFCGFFILYSYVIYPLILLYLHRFRRPIEPIFSSQTPPVSIIIAAYNEATVIEARVKNCLDLDYPKDKLELIIASDGSDDGTKEIVRRFAGDGVILLDFKQRRGKVNVLNDAVRHARHEIIAFSDANTHFEKDAVRKLVRYFQDPKVGGVVGQLRFVNAQGSKTADLEGVYWRFENFLKKVEGSRGALLGANGGIFAVRKALYQPCPSDTIVEDFLMPMKILEEGHKVMYDPEAMAVEEAAKHIIQEKKRRIRIGAGDFQALTLLGSMLDLRKGFPAFAVWSHKVLRWLAPFFLIFIFLTKLLLREYPLYRFTLFLQAAFYLAAFIGQMMNWAGVHIKIFSLCYYFVSMNLALLLGFVRFVAGSQRVAWDRTER